MPERLQGLQHAQAHAGHLTAALDPETVKEVLGVIRSIAAEGMTCVLVTHEMRFAREVADYVYFIDRGEVVEHATAQAFFDSPRDAGAMLTFCNTVRWGNRL